MLSIFAPSPKQMLFSFEVIGCCFSLEPFFHLVSMCTGGKIISGSSFLDKKARNHSDLNRKVVFFFELKARALPDHIRRRRSTKFIHVVIT